MGRMPMPSTGQRVMNKKSPRLCRHGLFEKVRMNRADQASSPTA